MVLDKTTGRIPAFLPLIVWAAYQLVLSKFNQNNYESANNNKKGESKTEKQKHTNGSGRIYCGTKENILFVSFSPRELLSVLTA